MFHLHYKKYTVVYLFYNEDETCSVLVDDLYAKTVTPNSVYHVIKNNKINAYQKKHPQRYTYLFQISILIPSRTKKNHNLRLL